MIALPSTSVEYLRTTVEASGDPTGTAPAFAFTVTADDPEAGDWHDGEWVGGTTYDARILVGPGTDVVLTEGRYLAWIKVTDNPEVIVMRCGEVTVT